MMKFEGLQVDTDFIAIGFLFYFQIAIILLNITIMFIPSIWPFYLLYVGWIFLVDNKIPFHKKTNRISSWLRRSSLFLATRRYFNARVIKTADIDPAKPHVFVQHPHGIFGVSVWANFLNDHEGSFSNVFPDIKYRTVTLENNFIVPFFREWLLCLGFIGSAKKSICDVLEDKTSVLLVVGGAEESLYARPQSNKVILKKRNGFIKIALQTGASLVPVYAFGENDAYEQLDNRPGTVLRWIQDTAKKLFRFTFPAVDIRKNRFFLPLRRDISTVVGEAIEIPKIADASHEVVEKYHQLYMDRLQELYQKHAKQMGCHNESLEFI
jgi:hypothetical protein